MSFPVEIFLGYGVIAVTCERCGVALVTPGSHLCPDCEAEELMEAPSHNDSQRQTVQSRGRAARAKRAGQKQPRV
jgi:uncharacterized Zn finger protein (UPF0148 family)